MIDVYGRPCMSLAELHEAMHNIMQNFPQQIGGPIWVRGAGSLFLPVKNVTVVPNSRGTARLDTFFEVHNA